MNWQGRSRKLTGFFLVMCLVTLSGFGCRQQTGRQQLNRSLVIWGLWQDSEDINPVLDAYTKQTGVKVEYKKIASVAGYEKQLLEALAQGRGPDIFVIHNSWVESKRGLLAPAPTSVVDERAVQDEFVDVVAQDVVRDKKVYALPTSVDTLALYYNKDILNAAGIPKPPATWTDVQEVVQKLTQVSRSGDIQQSAAALGTASNINRAMDILQLLMMQSGMPLYDPIQKQVTLATSVGDKALTFYTDFSNKAKKVYTWDLQQDFSIDAFSEGKTAMMFNYSYHIPTIQAKNPRLNFGVAPMPQIADNSSQNVINFAAYWPFAVSASTPFPQESWQLVRYLTSREPSLAINKAQQAPPARKDSVVELEREPVLGVFAEQTLTAHTWARPDLAQTDTIFNTAIDSVVTGSASTLEALHRAEDQLNQLIQDNQQQ